MVMSEPESATPQSQPPEGIIPPSAETVPVGVPGAPPPPPHQAVEAAHEMTEHAAPSPGPAEEPPSAEVSHEPVAEEEGANMPFAAPLELIDETVADEDLKFDWYI